MKKATIYDYAMMCRANIHKCENCPMWNYKCSISAMDVNDVDKANEIILKWCEEHPVETRQDRFLKMFPKAVTNGNGRISICPKNIDKTHECEPEPNECANCMDEYWLAEVEENEAN